PAESAPERRLVFVPAWFFSICTEGVPASAQTSTSVTVAAAGTMHRPVKLALVRTVADWVSLSKVQDLMVFTTAILEELTLFAPMVVTKVPEVETSPERSPFVTTVLPENLARLPDAGVPEVVTVPEPERVTQEGTPLFSMS